MEDFDGGSEPLMRFETLRDAVHGCSAAKEELFVAARHFLTPIARHELDSAFRVRVGESDLIQETLVLANAGLDRFKGSTDREFEAWLRSIFINCMLNHYRANLAQRRSIAREKILPAELGGDTDTKEQPDQDPSQIAIAKEERDILQRAVSKLPPIQQDVLRLRHQERKEFGEIGQRIERSAEAARKLWYRAFKEVTRLVKLDSENMQ